MLVSLIDSCFSSDLLFVVLIGQFHQFFMTNLLGAIEHKLFVASLNKQATPKEIEEVSRLNFLFSFLLLDDLVISSSERVL